MYPDHYLVGIQLFNRGDFFESHEVWEEEWRSVPTKDKDFYKGLIQIAVALCHYFNGNVRGARKLLQTGKMHLARYRPHYLGLNLDSFFSKLELCFRPIMTADPDQPIGLDLETVPKILLDPEPLQWPAIPDWIFDQVEDGRS